MTNQNHITGVMIQYFFTCHRELWFFGNRLNMNYEDENIKIGRQIQKESYNRETKDVLIDNTISIDFMEEKNIICEIKKSSILEKPKKMQLKYYLWYLKNNKGLELEGMLKYPSERKKVEISLSKKDEKKIEEALQKIPKILDKPNPPAPIEKPYCQNCSYYEFCKV